MKSDYFPVIFYFEYYRKDQGNALQLDLSVVNILLHLLFLFITFYLLSLLLDNLVVTITIFTSKYCNMYLINAKAVSYIITSLSPRN